MAFLGTIKSGKHYVLTTVDYDTSHPEVMALSSVGASMVAKKMVTVFRVGFSVYVRSGFWLSETTYCLSPGMNSQVIIKVALLSEAFPTLRTRKRSLPCVDPLVFHQVRFIAKELPAAGAGIWLLPRVSPTVCNQVRGAGEPLPAVRAGIRPLACVDSLVFNQVRLVGETFPA